MSHVDLLYEAGPTIGLGHRRRLEALSKALLARGASTDLRQLPARAHGDIVIVDSYLTDAGSIPRPPGARLVAIDDLERDLDVDLLVDPNPGWRTPPQSARSSLLGPMYALVDPELAETPTRPLGPKVDIVLVSAGGSDRVGVGAAIASEIRDRLPSVSVRLVIGPWGHQDVPYGVDAIESRESLHLDLAVSDVVVTGAGLTLVEAMVLGRPTITFAVAANQRRAAAGHSSAGAAVLANVSDAAVAAHALASDVERRRSLSAAARRQVDGRGSDRVAEAILAL